MKRKLIVCFFLVALFLTGCAKDKAPSTSNPLKVQSSTASPVVSGPLESASSEYEAEHPAGSESPSVESTVPTESAAAPTESISPTESTAVPMEDETTKPTEEERPMDHSCVLLVKGKDITSGNYVRINSEKGYAELPLLAILSALDAEVEWRNNTTAVIAINHREYLLDVQKGSLVEQGGSMNLLVVSPGTNHGTKYQVIDREFVIDSDSVKGFLIHVIGVTVRIDLTGKVITIG